MNMRWTHNDGETNVNKNIFLQRSRQVYCNVYEVWMDNIHNRKIEYTRNGKAIWWALCWKNKKKLQFPPEFMKSQFLIDYLSFHTAVSTKDKQNSKNTNAIFISLIL